jgi:hypothetical protein
MRLVFIHGIHEENKAPAALRRAWEHALVSAWRKAGLARPDYTLEMPYFGGLLADLAGPAHDAGRPPPLVKRAEGLVHVEEALLRDLGKILGVEAACSCAELAEGVVRSELACREWVQGILRFLESDVPGMGALLLRFARQVDAYLTSPEIRAAIDNIVRPSLLDGPTVIVAHSLGSIIAYRLLREAEWGTEVPLFVTLGSPLGIHVIKEHLSPPALAVPASVRKWLNATDERDCVALRARLDRHSFVDGIENVDDVQHLCGSPHAIDDYLGHPIVAAQIRASLMQVASPG